MPPIVNENNSKAYKVPELTPEQLAMLVDKWGDTYSTAEFRELERTYKSLAEDYRGGVSARQKMTLIDISKWRLERQKAMDSGDTQAAKRISDMIKATMDSEAMKAADIKPSSAIRVDAWAEKLEQKGLLRDGVLVLENVIKFVQTDRGCFQMSRDAIDMMMLSIYNAMRFNNGLSEVTELPREMQIQDALGEFADTITPNEKSVMMELGMYGAAKGEL